MTGRSPVADESVRPGPSVALPTPYGTFLMRAWVDATGGEHLSISCGGSDSGLVRVHSECLTGDAFGSYRCDCGEQLHLALRLIGQGGGMLVYVRGHEGRGVGLADKIRTYAVQDDGADTVTANENLGLPVDARSYGVAARILLLSGLSRVRLLSNNPHKGAALEAAGVRVQELVPLVAPARGENWRYLQTKRDKLGHYLPSLVGTSPDGGDAA